MINTRNIVLGILVIGAMLFIGSVNAEIPDQSSGEQIFGPIKLPIVASLEDITLNDLFVFGKAYTVTGPLMSTSYIFIEEVPESVIIVWFDENEKGVGCSILDGPVPGIKSNEMKLIFPFPGATQFKVFRL